jgi:minor extracellular protease Epr
MKNIGLSLAILLLLSCLSTSVVAVSAVNIKPIQSNKRLLDKVKRLPKKILPATPLEDKVNELSEQTDAQLNQLASVAPVVLTSGLNGSFEKMVEGGHLAIANQWVGLLSTAQLNLVKALPVTHLKQHQYANLELVLVSFRVPSELDSVSQLAKLLPAEIMQKLDRNHVFAPQADKNQSGGVAQSRPNTAANNSAVICQQAISVGMLDTAIELNHPYLATSQLVSKNFLSEEFMVPTDHATAVAGRFISSHQSAQGVAPKATIYAASVFYHRSDSTHGATVLNLINGLNWLAEQDIKVINLSLTGPDNKILMAVVSQLIKKDFSLVAAAGNQGPASPPLYPAAYQDVVAVTAIDQQQQIYRWANQGDYIDFAALGVEVLTTQANQSFGEESGTSLASPVVAAKLACQRFNHSQSHSQATQWLLKQATDLGDPGFDKQFGHGAIQ